LWENRALYLAPMSVAAVVMFGFSFVMINFPHRRREALLLDAVHQRAAIAVPYDVAAIMLILTAIIIGLFYCSDALHGERRDRSILFWKSLPVSDFTTVLSKVVIPLVVLPIVTIATILATQLFMLELSSAVLVTHGISPASTWANYNLFEQTPILVYGLGALSLWYAPLYAWLLLVSAWARRHPFVWAILPLIAISVLERIVFSTRHFSSMLHDRVGGFASEAFKFDARVHGSLPQVIAFTPFRFLSAPGLWVGLVFAAICVAGAVRLRRYREPI
jgi:ABC-2 type transport system permease protein